MTDEERKLAKERKRARNRARWAAMTPEERREYWRHDNERRASHGDYNVVGLYANGKLSKCGYALTKDGRETKSVAARRREVYARMARIKTGWRK